MKESIESNRVAFGHSNLYFSVDILFPRAIYYLYVLQAITDIPCDRYRTAPGSKNLTTLTTNTRPNTIWYWSSILSSSSGAVPKQCYLPGSSRLSGTIPRLSATQITAFRARTYTCSGSAITGLPKSKAEKPAFSCFQC